MRRSDRLKSEAREDARFRGHTLFNFERGDFFPNTTFYSECKDCGAGALVVTTPMPDGTGISGQAVSIHCKGV